MLYCHLWPVRLYRILPHYLINGTIFGKMLLNITYVCFDFLYNFLSESLIILRRIPASYCRKCTRTKDQDNLNYI
jgi:hypothetical protein